MDIGHNTCVLFVHSYCIDMWLSFILKSSVLKFTKILMPSIVLYHSIFMENNYLHVSNGGLTYTLLQ